MEVKIFVVKVLVHTKLVFTINHYSEISVLFLFCYKFVIYCDLMRNFVQKVVYRSKNIGHL